MRIHSASRRRFADVPTRFDLGLSPWCLILALGAAVAVGASLLPTSGHRGGPGWVGHRQDHHRSRGAWPRDGDTVLVKPGTYLESIVITEDITLRGDGDPGTVVIEFTADGPTHRLGG